MSETHVLVIYAHPAPHKSRVNRRLAQAARALAGVEVLDLYETYPDFYIDVAAEQARLERASAVAFVHPIQWYSSPSLLKEWVDTVLQAGWAYGQQGGALQGKAYWLVITAGGPEAAYTEAGVHGRPLDDYLPQFRQTAQLCGMRWEAPHILYAAHLVDETVVNDHVDAFAARLALLVQQAQAAQAAQHEQVEPAAQAAHNMITTDTGTPDGA